ncbi:MAG: DUF3857 domain-containing protein [Kiritimatiellales bacterium]|nr:DUF3857 domain-containing protein [Kiritimatiellales bacterium]
MRKFVYVALIAYLFIVSPLSAREFIDQGALIAAAKSVTLEKYPNADDVLVDDVIEVRYQPDGTSETWDDMAIKILTEKGKRKNRTLSLSYDTAYGTSEFTKVQVIKPDGTINEVDIKAQSKVMVDPGQMSANIYNPNSKVLQLSVPGLEIGDTLRYIAHEVLTKTVVPDTWSGYQVFEAASPIERYTYKVIAPKSLPLQKTILKAEVPGTVTHEKKVMEDTIVYTWQAKDVPRMFAEPNMPASYTVLQRLLVSTIEDWKDISNWYWDLCKPRLEATTPEMEAKAKELVKDCKTTREKIDAMFSFVSQDIRYMGITTEEEAPGYEPHDVKITFENRYGVCRDKAALLAAMLRLVDVEAFPVIIMAGPKKDEEVPQPFFNHAVTAALDDGKYVLMDSTDENTKDIFPSYLQNMSYLVARPGGETLLTSPVIPAEDNLLRITTTGTLDKAGNLEAESTLMFEGINDTAYRSYFARLKPEERRRFFEGHIKNSMPTAQLGELEILPAELRDTTQPMTVKMAFTADDLLIEGKDKQMLSLPRLGISLGYANFMIGQTGLEERKYPLYNRITAGIRETLQMEIPELGENSKWNDTQKIQSGQITWDQDIKQNNGLITATNNFLLNTVEFSPEEYLTLKQNLKDIEYNLRKKVILDVPDAGKTETPDIQVLEKTTHVELADSSHWKEAISSKIKILTYAGKKGNSEIKINYNPEWQEVKLANATVTHPDGTVKEISEKEINAMDASWVASAPRYPAEKILVANLPGVEIGSIIDYRIESTVKGKPFYSTSILFNGYDPIDKKTVTLTVPTSIELNIRNSGIAVTKTSSADTVTYTWTAENQPAVKKEEQLPSWWTFNPSVFISAGDWKTYAGEVRTHLLNAAKKQKSTEELAKEITDGLKDDGEKVEALRNWAAENLRAAGPSLTSLPFSAITPADQTLKERYGNSADRAVVLYTMLKAMRFKPEFVLAGRQSLIPEAQQPIIDVPQRQAFGSVLVSVKADGETIYLNDSSQYAQLGTSAHNHQPMIDLSDGTIRQVAVAPDKEERTHIVYNISIDPDGEAGITQTWEHRGKAFEKFHSTFAEITPEERRRYYLELVSSVSQSAKAASDLVTDYDAYPGQQEFSVAAERYAVLDRDYLYFTLPGGLGRLLQYRSNERDNPLAWENFIQTTFEYNIVLPEGYEPAILPGDLKWQAPGGAGTVTVTTEYSASANAVRIVQQADFEPALIPASEYQGVIKAGRKLAHPDMRTILLKRKETS